MILTSQNLFENWKKHLQQLTSRHIICSHKAAFESWFRIEFFSVLSSIGFDVKNIQTDYSYQSTIGKTDLFSKDISHTNIYELKCFVKNADSNKKDEFPKQIQHLISEFKGKYVSQVIAFATFIGYSSQQMINWKLRLTEWLGNEILWDQIGPKKILQNYELEMWIACSKEKESIRA